MTSTTYGGYIWTHHAMDRIGQRGLSQDMAWQALRYPDATGKGNTPDSIQYQKKFGISTVTVIAKQTERREWIVLSCWIDPPVPGTVDARKKEYWKAYKKAGFWGKLWYTLLRQIGV